MAKCQYPSSTSLQGDDAAAVAAPVRAPACGGAALKPRWSAEVFPAKGVLYPKILSRGVAWMSGPEAVNWTALARRGDGGVGWIQPWGGEPRAARGARDAREGGEADGGGMEARGRPDPGSPRGARVNRVVARRCTLTRRV